MVRRIFQHRPHHRVVSPERREPFPDGERDGGASLTCRKRSNGKELVDVRVGMTPVHEAFPPGSEGQLAIGHQTSLEVERAGQAEPPVREGPPGQEDWMKHPHLCPGAGAGDRVVGRCGQHCLGRDYRPALLRRHPGRRPGRIGEPGQDQQAAHALHGTKPMAHVVSLDDW